MIAVVARRIVEAIITLILFSMIVFATTHVLGDPVIGILGPDSTVAQRADLRHELGLDKPLVTQYLTFVGHAARGDLGTSFQTNVPVWTTIKDRLPASLLLAVFAMIVALLISVPLAVLSATRRGSLWDSTSKMTSLVGQGTPSFLLGMIAVWVFALEVHWFPAGGKAGFMSYVLPTLTLAWFIGAGIYRLLRASLLESLQADYVLYARSLGISSWRIVWTWALPNALVGVLAFIGYMFGAIMAGAIVIETVFVWPGLGSLAYQAILSRDVLLIEGAVLVIAVLMIVSNLAVDLLQIAIDPRLRHPRSGT